MLLKTEYLIGHQMTCYVIPDGSEQIEDCPFCNCRAVSLVTSWQSPYAIKCDECGAAIDGPLNAVIPNNIPKSEPERSGYLILISAETALKRWNRRAGTPRFANILKTFRARK